MYLTGDLTWHSFLWDAGEIKDLGTLGGTITTAVALNNAGHVVGRSDVTAICETCPAGDQKQLHHPFFWKDGAITDIGVVSGDTAGTAYSVNANDQAVGRTTLCTKVNPNDSCDNVTKTYHAFLWENGSIADLQTLVLPGSGITVNDAMNINDRGEIVGYGTLSSGNQHAVLLIPCDVNHPNVEGCDYSLVSAATVQSGTASIDPAATQANLKSSETTDRVRARNRRFGVLAPK